MEFVFLGTGAGIPSKGRNVSAIALHLLEERGTTWLFDCGEATQHQVLHTNVRLRKVEKIFISHLHGDHIFGLPGLLGSRSFQGGEDELTVYGPKGLKDFIEVSLRVSNTHIKYPLHIVEIEEGVIFEDDHIRVEVRKLEHGIPSYGYRLVERDVPGALLVDKLQALGIKPGPLYKKIKDGEVVELVDGSIINGKDFIGPPQQGKIIAILGDTRICSNNYVLAEGADVLVHEATFAAEEEANAYEFYHSTTAGAANVAKKAGVGQLILTHVSSRYQGADCAMLVQEAQDIFPNTVLAEDFTRIVVKKARF
ncbi:ribonuclease Z [Priestia taiwanensis]|uniref:Ribonuclease Z n=1 Tax=Priestia taiwanensis TaxID=1347902 RepID=A0A917ELQ5_9BACI|nr:ribonuclease Z [Priestia taiwanensis]MBM7361442.1 ribonuclease Z [Priestia taiwanensis]GGE54182.1 ribonuclease Z [Priestia taiwanensis]